MTGKEDRPWQITIRNTGEDEIEELVEKLSPDAGWAYQERENEGELLLYYYRLPPDELLKSTGKEFEVSKSPSWEEKFRETFRGVEVGRFFVRPPWIEEKKGLTDIVIYPASGFGTGEHETTQGMLLMIEKLLNKTKPRKVLDVGTGSGILAIACSKLGVPEITAIDKDELAISNAKENLKLNSVYNVRLILGTPEAVKGEFDLILANIDFFTLVENIKNLKRLVRKEGYLIISGFLEEDRETLLDMFKRAGFKPLEHMCLNQWVCALLRNAG